MKLSLINSWLNKRISIEEIKAELAPYLKEFLKKMTTRGAVIPLFLTEDIHISLGHSEFYFLCTSFLEGDLTEIELSYIAELLLLAPSVVIEDEKVIEGLEFLCDFDIYGKFSRNDVENLLKTE